MNLNKLPKHIAICLDGNRRWADAHSVQRKVAIYHGIKKVKEILFEWTKKFQAEYDAVPFSQLTIYALTLNNVQNRPKGELTEIYKAFARELRLVVRETAFKTHGIALRIGGKREVLPPQLQEEIARAEAYTRNFSNYSFFIPLAYDGNEEVLQAFEKAVCSESPTRETLTQNLYFPTALPVDLMIRTGGEMRLSGFMMWYIGYAELFFTKSLPEDFSYNEFITILEEYCNRDRRFGK